MPTTRTAHLITPQGKRIPLSPRAYEAILNLLEERGAAPALTRPEIGALLRETRGKYAGRPSLVQALLAERRIEREREEGKHFSRGE